MYKLQMDVLYKLIGFVTFWVGVLGFSIFFLFFSWASFIFLLSRFQDWLWENTEKSSNNTPTRWKHVLSFFVMIIHSILTLKKPQFWRWRNYRDNYNK